MGWVTLKRTSATINSTDKALKNSSLEIADGPCLKKAGGVLPLAMCKYWSELMGMAGSAPRLPVLDMAPEDKAQLKQELEAVLSPALVAGR